MLKLLKYDFRRNRDQFLGVLVVMILLQATLIISADVSHWQELDLIVLSIGVFVLTGIVLMIMGIRTYTVNLKSYQRGLLPVQTIYRVLSPLILTILLMLAVIAVFCLHSGVLSALHNELVSSYWPQAWSGLLLLLWSAIFLMLYLMFTITVLRTFKSKGKVWIGIVLFFILVNAVSFVEGKLFGDDYSTLEGAFQLKLIEESDSGAEVWRLSSEIPLGPLLFEILLAVVLILIMTQLVKRRNEY